MPIDIEERVIARFREIMAGIKKQYPAEFAKLNSYIISQSEMKEGSQKRGYDFVFFESTDATYVELNKVNQDNVRDEGIPCTGINIYNANKTKDYTGIIGQFWITFGESGRLEGIAERATVRKSNSVNIGFSGTRRICHSTISFPQYPKFTGNSKFVQQTRTVIGLLEEFIKGKPIKGYYNCTKTNTDNKWYLTYYPYPIGDKKQYFIGHSGVRPKRAFVGNSYIGDGNRGWKPELKSQDIAFPSLATNAPPEGFVIYTNSYDVIAQYSRDYPSEFREEYFKLINHPKEIPAKHGGGYMCDGRPWDDSNVDSTLADDIKDLLDKEGKTFYLLGKPTGSDLPKLYLFDLGQVQGVLKYTHILDAVCYKQENCQWVKESPKVTIKFSSIEGEVDTNFYLLTPDKLEQPSTITKITHRKANEYLIKHFPVCTVPRPEGGTNPDDNLKPDFGGGSGSGGSGSIGGGGFFPEHNNPLPLPEVPPCDSHLEGGSQVPVSTIYLISVPELTPSYNDTYDFPDKDAQSRFFINKKSFKVTNYSYLRKDNAIQIGSHVDNIHCYNYLMYKNKYGKWYYCFIMDKQYINERTARIIIATDVLQTYLFDYVLKPCFVERCHVPRWKDGGKTPTDEFEPEGLEFGEPIQESYAELSYHLSDTYIAVCSNPLGKIPSRQKPKNPPNEKGVDSDGKE